MSVMSAAGTPRLPPRQHAGHLAGCDSERVSPQIATNTVVTKDELIEFVRPRHHAILITARSDASPQASPVTCGVDEAGRIVVATYPARAKTRNARKDPRVSVVVLSDDFDGPWVQIDGDAEVMDVPEAVEPLVSYYRAVAGEHADWAGYRGGHAAAGQIAAARHGSPLGPRRHRGLPARVGLTPGPRRTIAADRPRLPSVTPSQRGERLS
jgi:PPOX class probable F420-dependent enzyme